MKTQKVNVAIIHGIGINTSGYAEPLIKGIREVFQSEIQAVLKRTEDVREELNFIPVVWDDIVGPKEAILTDIFRGIMKTRQKKSILQLFFIFAVLILVALVLSFFFKHFWFFLLLVAGLVIYVPRILFQLRTSFAADFVADITSYNEESAKKLILMRIEENLKTFCPDANRSNLTLISHSLGTVIASDFVWERQKPGQLLDEKLILHNFFTMGSPLPIFSLQFGGPETFNKPIAVSDPQGRWVNIFDNDDPIAYPLKPLNDAYHRVVLRDQEVNVGLFGVAHVKYWTHSKVHRLIGRKLAYDWMKLNDLLSPDVWQAFYKDYDDNLGLN